MSYDLMVFDPAVAPRDRGEFLEWYRDVTEWRAGRDYARIAGATGNLPLFYETMRAAFPPMNGPDAPRFGGAISRPKRGFFARLLGGAGEKVWDEDAPELTDYSIAESAIYMGFAWSLSDAAHKAVFFAALRCEVGFFDVSAEEGVILYEPGDFDRLMGL